MRNAEAHEDFAFDEDTGLLVVGDATFHPNEIRRANRRRIRAGLGGGRLAEFADQPTPAGGIYGSPVGSPASAAMAFDREPSVTLGSASGPSSATATATAWTSLSTVRPEACDPCFVALTQTAQVLPTVSRFVVRLPGSEEPVIDLPADVLHTNWPVFDLAARLFPDALPHVTFLPCLTWVRLSGEPVEEAARVAADGVLCCERASDAEAAVSELVRLPELLSLVLAVASATCKCCLKAIILRRSAAPGAWRALSQKPCPTAAHTTSRRTS